MRAGTTLLVLLALSIVGCGDDEAPARPTPTAASGRDDGPVMRPTAGGVSWTAEEPLVFRRPDNEYRSHEYEVRDHPGTELAISHFAQAEGGGGSVQENLDRWIAQLEQPGGGPSRAAAQIETREINDLRVTTIDLSGTFVGRRGMTEGGPPRPGWRLLGAIVEGEQGLVFFKLTGPADGVDAAAQAFHDLVETIHPD